MKQVIYLDILIAVNLFVNYFLLLSTAKFLCLKWKPGRLILGEFLGAVYSLYIFVPIHNIFFSLVIKLLMSFTIIWATFGIKNIGLFFKTLACFYSINFAFSGIMMALWNIYRPNGMEFNNGVIYFNISPLILIIFTLISYIIIEFINRITEKKKIKNTWCKVKVNYKNNHILINAKVDTGNLLKEPFSNLPVMVVKKSAISDFLPKNMITNLDNLLIGKFDTSFNQDFKSRIVPFKTISGDGVLPAFKPDFINLNNSEYQKEIYIAICKDDMLPKSISALINPEILD